MKRLRIDAIAFIAILAGLGIANLLNVNKPAVSTLENRMLKAKPELTWSSLSSGDYFRDFEDYYSDTFINRDNIVKLCRDIKDSLSLNREGVTLVVTREQNEPINDDTTRDRTSENQTVPRTTPEPWRSIQLPMGKLLPHNPAGKPCRPPQRQHRPHDSSVMMKPWPITLLLTERPSSFSSSTVKAWITMQRF